MKLELISHCNLPKGEEQVSRFYFDRELGSLFFFFEKSANQIVRNYHFSFDQRLKRINFEKKEDLHFLDVPDTVKNFHFTAATELPWGNWLVVGQDKQTIKIFDIKKNKHFVREFDIPEKIQNKVFSTEISADIENNDIYLTINANTDQQQVVKYSMPEAWVIKPTTVEEAFAKEKNLFLILGKKLVSQNLLHKNLNIKSMCWGPEINGLHTVISLVSEKRNPSQYEINLFQLKV